MKYALLFREHQPSILVSAEDVKNGLYSKNEEFVDPEYEFKVCFVKGARNNGGPYFRMYYSYEEYKALFPERASRYEIVANMRKYKENLWHKRWKNNFSDFCSIEKCIKNKNTNKWKFADAYCEKTQTCIEFQNSYISFDFEERNTFYSDLKISTVWLYNLPHANARQNEQGNIEILEDNARGFFRISENADNLKKHLVYIQVKSGTIYRVIELFRKDSSTEHKSTIRYFIPTEVYSETDFITAIKNNSIVDNSAPNDSSFFQSASIPYTKTTPKPLSVLWNSKFSWMIVQNVKTNQKILINRNQHNEMFRDFKSNCIKYKYIDNSFINQHLEERKEYFLSHKDERSAIWVLIKFKIK